MRLLRFVVFFAAIFAVSLGIGTFWGLLPQVLFIPVALVGSVLFAGHNR